MDPWRMLGAPTKQTRIDFFTLNTNEENNKQGLSFLPLVFIMKKSTYRSVVLNDLKNPARSLVKDSDCQTWQQFSEHLGINQESEKDRSPRLDTYNILIHIF